MKTAAERTSDLESLIAAYRSERRSVELAAPTANHFGRDRSLCSPKHIRVIEKQFELYRAERLAAIDEQIAQLERQLEETTWV